MACGISSAATFLRLVLDSVTVDRDNQVRLTFITARVLTPRSAAVSVNFRFPIGGAMSKDEGERIELEGHVSFEPPTMSAEMKVYKADDVRLEKSQTVRYLWSPSGAYLCNYRILILVDGKWHELTREKGLADYRSDYRSDGPGRRGAKNRLDGENRRSRTTGLRSLPRAGATTGRTHARHA